MSLLSICVHAANNAGVVQPATVLGPPASTDPAAIRLLEMARREARYISRKTNWTALTVENVFIANGTSTYTLPADFRSLVDNTMWDRTRFWRMRGAMTPQQWQMYKSSVIGRATIERRWRLRMPSGDPAGATVQFEMDPALGSTDVTSTFVYEYVSNNHIRSATNKAATNAAVVAGGTPYALGNILTVVGGTPITATTLIVTGVSSGVITSVEVGTPGNYLNANIPTNPVSVTGGAGSGATFTITYAGLLSSDWVADTDTSILDEDVMELGVIWRLLRRLGLAYDEEKEEYQRALDMVIARDGGTATLSLAPGNPLTLIGPYNVPETGFGP